MSRFKTLGKLALVTTLTGGALLATASIATAEDSSTVNNCYTRTYNTAWVQQCLADGASQTGYYQSTVNCDWGGSGELVNYRTAGSTDRSFGDECWNSASSPWIGFSVQEP